MDADDLLSETRRIDELDKRLRRHIEASDFGPNTPEVIGFLQRLDGFTWEDWRLLQRAYVKSLETTVLPSIKLLEEAAAKAGLSDQVMAAGWAAMDRFPVANWETMPDDIDGRLCGTACATGARAVAGRSLVPERDFELIFQPFTQMTPRVAARRAGCGNGAAALLVAGILLTFVVSLHPV